MKTFERLIEKNYPGLNFILTPDENHLPGAIIDKNDTVVDHLKNINLFDSSKILTKEIEANIANANLTFENSLDFSFSLLGIIKLNTKTQKNYSVDFSFKNVKKIVFNENGYYENDIKEILMQLKSQNKPKFLKIKRDFVIMQSLFVDELIITLKKDSQIFSEADFVLHQNDFEITGNYSWNKNGQLVINNTKKVPFGVIDLKIKNRLYR